MKTEYKVKCISENSNLVLTQGKIYDVYFDTDDFTLYIIDDEGDAMDISFERDCLEPLND